MGATPQLDFSAAQPVNSSTASPAASGPSLDFSAAQPANPGTTPTTPILSKMRDAFHAVADPVAHAATDYGNGYLKEGGRTIGGLMKILGNVISPDEPANTHYLSDALPDYPGEKYIKEGSKFAADHLRRGADYLNKDTELNGAWQHLGGFGENIAELMSPEALASLGKTAEVAKAGEVGGKAQQLADASKVAALLKKYPRVASLVGLGLSAARAGTETGVQTFVKSGGNADEAIRAGELGAGTGAALGALAKTAGPLARRIIPATRSIEGVDIPVERIQSPNVTPQAAKGAEAYTATARAAVRPSLESIGLSPDEVEKVLSGNHDFTGLTDRLQERNGAAYDTLDKATGGRFRTVNGELQEAKDKAFSNDDMTITTPEGMKKKLSGDAAYKYKQEEMDALLDAHTGGEVTPEMVGAVKGSFHQGYVLGDVGRVLDRSLDGLPGRSNVSQEQRGINGNELEKGIQQVVERHGYDTVVKALGPGRLENLQAIAAATRTNAQRATFNRAIHHVAGFLGASLGAGAGAAASGGNHYAATAGAGMGYAAGLAAKDTVATVLNAVRLNPRVGRSLLFMLDKGSDPKVYGPLIGSMITQSEASTPTPAQSDKKTPQNPE